MLKRAEVYLCDYFTEEHKRAVTNLMIQLSGVELKEIKEDSLIIEVTDEHTLKILEDMNICDYISIAFDI